MAVPAVVPSMVVDLIQFDEIVSDRSLDNVPEISKAELPVSLDQHAKIDIAAPELDQAKLASDLTDTMDRLKSSEQAEDFSSESESHDDEESPRETPKISEKRRFQNAVFSAQYVGHMNASRAILVAYRSIACHNGQQRLRRMRSKQSWRTPIMTPSQSAASLQNKILVSLLLTRENTKLSFSKKPRSRTL